MARKIEINRGAKSTIGQSGIGYIVVPNEEKKDDYIKDCYRTSTVTINGGFGYGYIDNVSILPDVLQDIKFPEKAEDRGTAVFWIRENFYNRPIIVGIIPDDDYTNLLVGGQKRILQRIGNNFVEIFLDSLNSQLNINVVGDGKKPSNINIKTCSGTEDSEIKIYTDGTAKVSANALNAVARKDFNIQLRNEKDEELIRISGNGEKFEYKDQYKTNLVLNKNNVSLDTEIDVNVKAKNSSINANAENINLKTNSKLNIDNGKEPMVLGNQLSIFFQKLLNGLIALPVPQPNKTVFIELLNELETFKSKKSNLD